MCAYGLLKNAIEKGDLIEIHQRKIADFKKK
jgi:hypothetical protein